MHCARTALGNAAAKLGACHAQLVAQHPQQGHLGLDVYFMAFTVDIEFQHARILGFQNGDRIGKKIQINQVQTRITSGAGSV
jgi:hypothetical protein